VSVNAGEPVVSVAVEVVVGTGGAALVVRVPACVIVVSDIHVLGVPSAACS
jgi:hypothetical protein